MTIYQCVIRPKVNFAPEFSFKAVLKAKGGQIQYKYGVPNNPCKRFLDILLQKSYILYL